MNFLKEPSTRSESAKSRNRKRLIVLCDGTWQDSTSDDDTEYPSNVTRFARALKEVTYWKKDENSPEEEIEQIVYYQKGVGTGVLDHIIGGASGIGVSANVRAGYSFLAHNYDVGDQIYFFGFSRGAYTARLIAGLVAAHGLLTKKGMDSFPYLYQMYYKDQKISDDAREAYIKELNSKGLIQPEAARAIEVIGVWDTVAFHQAWISRTVIAKIFGIGTEYVNFRDTKLSPNVKYGFQALALDERRKAYSPTLWTIPKASEGGSTVTGPYRLKELTQVWFSGRHTDVGGGNKDHRLSDIALAWMIAQCSKEDLLAFDKDYLTDVDQQHPQTPAATPWGTHAGATASTKSGFWWFVDQLYRIVPFISADRTPLAYEDSNESIHSSILDRKFGSNSGGVNAVAYECKLLTGQHDNGAWQLKRNKNLFLKQVKADQVEEFLKGRIRPAKNNIEK